MDERIAGHKEENDKVQKLGMNVRKQLKRFRDVNLAASQHYKYQNYHSLIGLSGCLAYAIGQADNSYSPLSPAAWLVASVLQCAGIAMQLRPGWKCLPPLTLHENSRLLWHLNYKDIFI
jgi:hypothetical protein